jgi:hypothetical protein
MYYKLEDIIYIRIMSLLSDSLTRLLDDLRNYGIDIVNNGQWKISDYFHIAGIFSGNSGGFIHRAINSDRTKHGSFSTISTHAEMNCCRQTGRRTGKQHCFLRKT